MFQTGKKLTALEMRMDGQEKSVAQLVQELTKHVDDCAERARRNTNWLIAVLLTVIGSIALKLIEGIHIGFPGGHS